MTDNSSLVPSQSSPNFAQQGQLDWVAVARTPVAFTLDVLARYGKAGVDALTVGIARAVCSQFDLKPAAQKRLEESISKLKTVHSFGKIAWFGFGLKHIIDDLLETEQGAACVALSGCLTTSYDTEFASQILRSICQLKGAPGSLTPSLRQWGALVSICAGSLTNSQFPLFLIGFEKLLTMHLRDRGCRAPPQVEALARAIIILGSLSKRELRSATFSGGLDCAWVAAMAEWMLCLGVEINDSSGYTLYRSQSLSSGEIAHVIINVDALFMESSSGLTHRTFYIPSGKHLLRTIDGNDYALPGTAVKRSVPWADILGASFGQEIISSLLDALYSTIGPLFEHLLEYTNNPSYRHNRTSYLSPWDVRPRREFAEWAMWRLPELRSCIEHSIGQFSSSSSYQITIDDLEECWYSIKGACSCPRCSPQLGIERKVCLEILTLTILEYLSILHTLSIDPTIFPSCSGLLFLYDIKAQQPGSLCMWKTFDLQSFDLKYDFHFGLMTIFEILTGQKLETTHSFDQKSAVSANGTCMFMEIMSDLDVSPLGIKNIKVIPGYIEFEGSQCVETLDFPYSKYDQWRHSNDTSYNMVVHQKWHDASIQIGYQLRSREIEGPAIGLWRTSINVLEKRTLRDCTVWCQAEGHYPHNHYSPLQQTSDKDKWLAVALTRLAKETDDKHYRYALEAFRYSYPQLYIDVLVDRPNSRVCFVRIKNCSKCMLMYAAETLFDQSSPYISEKWAPTGTIIIRRWRAEEVQIELEGSVLKYGGRYLPGHPLRKPNAVGVAPLFPNVPLDHDPVD